MEQAGATVKQVPAVARALDILELFLDEPGPLSAPRIAASLRLPRTSVHQLLITLVSRGYLDRSDERAHGFSLGLRAFELGSAYAARLDLAREGRRIAMELVATCGETVSVTVLEGTEVVYLVTVESTQAVRAVTVGRMPAHCTASGKAQLACLPREEVDRRYAGVERLGASTPNTITSLDRLHRELDEIRLRGVAIDDEEAHLNQRCVAVAVFGHDGAVAALTISAPAMRMEGEEMQRFITLARRAAADYSRRLGHRAEVVGS